MSGLLLIGSTPSAAPRESHEIHIRTDCLLSVVFVGHRQPVLTSIGFPTLCAQCAALAFARDERTISFRGDVRLRAGSVLIVRVTPPQVMLCAEVIEREAIPAAAAVCRCSRTVH